MNYDTERRIKVEEFILSFIINNSSNKEYEKLKRRLLEEHKINSSDYFYGKFSKEIFNTIKYCWDEGLIADLITVINMRPSEYRDEDNPIDSKGFDHKVVSISSLYCSYDEFEQYLLILKQYNIQDFWNQKAEDIIYNNWDIRDSLIVSENIINSYNLMIDKFTSGIKSNENDIVDEARKEFELRKKGISPFIPTGFAPFDVFTGGGFRGPEFTILAARPSMGKTSFALTLAINSSFTYGKKGIFISLEMSKKQLMNKIMAKYVGIDYERIKNYDVTEEEFSKIEDMYRFFETKSNLKIYDASDLRTLSQILNKIRAEKPDYVIVDYIQLTKLDKKSNNREQEVSEISRNYKLLALEMKIPIICLSQLSRAAESRSNKRPLLSDLRESGSLEQDADNVIFLYRDSYYRLQLQQQVAEYELGNIEVNLAKGRDTGVKVFEANLDMKNYTISSGFKYNN